MFLELVVSLVLFLPHAFYLWVWTRSDDFVRFVRRTYGPKVDPCRAMSRCVVSATFMLVGVVLRVCMCMCLCMCMCVCDWKSSAVCRVCSNTGVVSHVPHVRVCSIAHVLKFAQFSAVAVWYMFAVGFVLPKPSVLQLLVGVVMVGAGQALNVGVYK